MPDREDGAILDHIFAVEYLLRVLERTVMSLLHEIQASVLQADSDLGPILLKLRLLAAKLGAQPLSEWVKLEAEGYPKGAKLPDYRIVPVSYTASFCGDFSAEIRNAPIPPYCIQKFAGESWVYHKMRQSIAAVDDLLGSSSNGGSLGIDAANLIPLLQGKVYPAYTCIEVKGTISRTCFVEIRHSVRSRVLELTIELEKSVPEASAVVLGKSEPTSSGSAAAATQIAQQIIYNNVTSVSATGDAAHIQVVVGERDLSALVEFLRQAGLPEGDAKELAQIAASEEPESKVEPFGVKARKWLLENLCKIADGTQQMGLSVATDVIREAFLKYYGLK